MFFSVPFLLRMTADYLLELADAIEDEEAAMLGHFISLVSRRPVVVTFPGDRP